ncbi:HP1 family phage holin [Morganella morganii]|uniref:HP1 family phage holin n=1 Tax=Morganella morganii TaxID=582 RepID=UPI003D2FB180
MNIPGPQHIPGGLSLPFRGLSLDQCAVLIGIVCTIGTFFINWYYRRRGRKNAEQPSAEGYICRAAGLLCLMSLKGLNSP